MSYDFVCLFSERRDFIGMGHLIQKWEMDWWNKCLSLTCTEVGCCGSCGSLSRGRIASFQFVF